MEIHRQEIKFRTADAENRKEVALRGIDYETLREQNDDKRHQRYFWLAAGGGLLFTAIAVAAVIAGKDAIAVGLFSHAFALGAGFIAGRGSKNEE